MKRLLTIAVLAFVVSLTAQDYQPPPDERSKVERGLDKAQSWLNVGRAFEGVLSGDGAADQALAYQQMSNQAQLQHEQTLQNLRDHDLLDVLTNIGTVSIVAFTLCMVLLIGLAFDPIREALSAGYRKTRLTRQILDQYEKDFAEGRFQLTDERATLLGLSNIGWSIFGGLVLLAVLSLFGTIVTISIGMF